MRKLKPFIIVFGIIIVVAIVLYFYDNNSTFRKSQIDFAITNGDDIQRIELTNSSDTFILSKVQNSWVYNNISVARNDALVNLFRLLSNIQVKAPVRGNFEEIFRSGTTISIIDKSNNKKQYIVAEDTDKRISVAKILGSDKVFEVEVSGYPPRIMPFYRTDLRWWRDKAIVKLDPEQILSISLINTKDTSQSFTILNYGKGRYGIKPTGSVNLINNVSSERLVQYLSSISNIEVSDFVETDNIDTIIYPRLLQFRLTIKTLSGEKINIDSYSKVGDHNQLYIYINNSQLAIGKYMVFDLLLVDISFFINNVK